MTPDEVRLQYLRDTLEGVYPFKWRYFHHNWPYYDVWNDVTGVYLHFNPFDVDISTHEGVVAFFVDLYDSSRQKTPTV
jgi:hypothetical protein